LSNKSTAKSSAETSTPEEIIDQTTSSEETLDAFTMDSTPVASVKSARFAPLETGSTTAGHNTMDLLLDVQLELSVELGRAKIPVKDVLQLGSGSVIELDKLGGEPVDILVNGRLIARGEVVVVDENYGVRVIEIISQSGASALAA